MFLFQSLPGAKQLNAASQDYSLNAIQHINHLVENHLHVDREILAGQTITAMANIRSKNQTVYVDPYSIKSLSFERPLSQKEKELYNSWYSNFINDQDYVNSLRTTFIKERKFVKASEFDEFAKGYIAYAVFTMVQHAQNFKPGAIDHVEFSKEMAQVCATGQCIVFNIMKEVEKLRPDLFGAKFQPKTDTMGVQVDLPSSSLLAINNSNFEFSSASEKKQKEILDKTFMPGTYDKLVNNLMPKLFNIFEKQQAQTQALPVFASRYDSYIPNTGQRIRQAETLFRTQEEGINQEKKKGKKMLDDAEGRKFA